MSLGLVGSLMQIPPGLSCKDGYKEISALAFGL